MEICAICLDTPDESAYTTICGHIYHRSCLEPWLLKQATCPMCRAPCVIDKLPRYRVRSPQGKHKWCSNMEKFFAWYVSFRNDNVILSGRLGVKLSLEVQQIKEAAIHGRTVRVLYLDKISPNSSPYKSLFLLSDNPAQLVGAIGCFFYECKDRRERGHTTYSSI